MSTGPVPPPGAPQFSAPGTVGPPLWNPVPLSDEDLRRLPPPPPPAPVTVPLAPAAAGYAPPARAATPQRPAVVALAVTLAVTASLQWLCALSFAWVVAVVGGGDLGNSGDNGVLFHLLNRFNDRLLDGLAWPLFGFPLASVVTGFLLLRRRPWTRIAHTVVGVAALGWSAWWLRDDLGWWFSAGAYVTVACLVLWTRTANAWYGSALVRPAAGPPV